MSQLDLKYSFTLLRIAINIAKWRWITAYRIIYTEYKHELNVTYDLNPITDQCDNGRKAYF